MPAFQRELQGLRPEIKPGVSNQVIAIFPKYEGKNIYPDSTYTYVIKDPDGTTLHSGTCSQTLYDSSAYSKLYATIQASWFTDADIGEDYRCEFTWSASAPTRAGFDVVFFDVVLYPYPPMLSLNAMLEERPDIGETLDRLGRRLNYDPDADSDYSEDAAQVFAYRARIELDAMIRDALAQYKINTNQVSTTGVYTSSQLGRPNLILNRERITNVERKLAIKLIYLADCSDPEGDTETAGLFRFYQRESEIAWRGVGPLKFDFTEDLTPDHSDENITRTVRLVRGQA